jgi:hypothetical protein
LEERNQKKKREQEILSQSKSSSSYLNNKSNQGSRAIQKEYIEIPSFSNDSDNDSGNDVIDIDDQLLSKKLRNIMSDINEKNNVSIFNHVSINHVSIKDALSCFVRSLKFLLYYHYNLVKS